MNPEQRENFCTLALHTLKCFWGTIAICLALMAMLRIQHIVSHTLPFHPKTLETSK